MMPIKRITNRFTPIIDTREQYPFSFEESEFCTKPIVIKLDSGDYSIAGYEDKLFIERKANVAELAVNFTQKRWKNELERVKDYRWKFLVCEFNYEHVLVFPQGSTIPEHRRKYLKVSPAFILACISNLQVQHGINVVMASNKFLANSVCLDIMKRVYATRIS